MREWTRDMLEYFCSVPITQLRLELVTLERLVDMIIYSSLVESLMPQRRKRVGRESDYPRMAHS